MAEALLREMNGEEYEVFSAGTLGTKVHPTAVKVLEEKGIDTGRLFSKSLDEFLDKNIDLVVTVCNNAREACPFLPGAKEYIHQAFPDPPDLVSDGMEEDDAFRKVRDMIEDWIAGMFLHK
jgi:arsenate reductase